MAVDITALYCCLDDFCKVFADWEAHRLLPSEQARQRSGKLSRAEMLFMVGLFPLSTYKNFKAFYLCGDGLARTLMYEAAIVILHRVKRPLHLKACAEAIEQRSGPGKVRVALARKL